MSTDTQETAEQTKAREKAEKDAARKAKAEEQAAAKAEKAKEREAEKERKAKEREEAKAKREAEAITKILAELPEDKRPDSIDGLTRDNARDLVKAHKAEERKNRPKKAALTLSQRRALLKLGEGPIVPKTGFNALPLDYLVSVDLAEKTKVSVEEAYQEVETRDVEIPEAERTEGGPTTKTEKVKVDKTRNVEKEQYALTDTGKERVKDINPKWRDWKPAERADSTPADETAAA